MTGSLDKKLSFCFLTIPGMVLYLLVVVYPVLSSLVLGFTSWNGFGLPVFNGLDNFAKIFASEVFWTGFKNNMLIMVISVFGQIPAGFVLAYLLYRGGIRFEGFFKAMIFLPVAISAIVVAILWKKILSPEGIAAWVFRQFSGDPTQAFRIFENPDTAVLPILFVIFWMFTGVYMIMFFANLQKISPSLIEAALMDGASEGRILFQVIVPSMVGILFTTVIFAVAGSFKAFDVVYAMTGGGPAHMTEVIAIHMYNQTFTHLNYGYGSAVSTILVVLSLACIGLARLVFGSLEKKYG